MAITISFSGVTYTLPSQAERNWAEAVNTFFNGIAANALPKAGGNFTLSGDLNLGNSADVYIKALASNTTGIATAGFIRLAKTDKISFRNNAGDGDLDLGINASDRLTFANAPLALLSEVSSLASATATDLVNINTAITNLTNATATSLSQKADAAATATALNSKLNHTNGVASGLRIDDFLEFDEEAAPATPAAGKGRIRLGTDKKFYQVTSDGISKALGGGGLEGIEVAANVNPAVNGTMYEYGTLSAPRTLTLPTGTGAFVIGVIGNATLTNYLDVIPASGTIEGAADTERYRYARFNAVYYRAEGSTDIKVARQATTMIQPGMQTGYTGGAVIGAGMVGEKITWTTPPGTVAVTTTEADWSSAFITLTPGVWLIVANLTAYVGTGAVAGNDARVFARITNASNVTVENQERELYLNTVANASNATISCLSMSCTVSVSANTIYKIRAQKSETGSASVQLRNQSQSRSDFYAVRIA